MALYRDAAIVLRTQKLGEADRIVTLLTRQHGKVRAVAKGVRRTRSRFGARLEPFMVVDVQLYEGRSLDIVTQAETLAPYGDAIARDYVAYTAATAMLETAERLTEERAPSLQQYLLLVGGLRSLAGGEHETGLVLDAYLLRSLAVAGWAPSFHDCARCGAPGPAQGVQPRAAAAPSARPAAPPGSAAPGPADPRAARRPARRRLGRSPTPARTQHRREGSGLVAAFLQWHLERGVRSLRAGGAGMTTTRPSRTPSRGAAAGACPPTSCPGTSRSSWTATAGGPTPAGCRAPRATRRGEAALLDVVAGAIEIGVKHLSAYAFSTENWKRSPDEVRFLMGFNRDVHPPPPRHAQRVGRAGPLGRPAAAAVAQRDQGARGRRGADRGTTTC